MLLLHHALHGRIPLEEWRAHHRDRYLHNKPQTHPCPYRDSKSRSLQSKPLLTYCIYFWQFVFIRTKFCSDLIILAPHYLSTQFPLRGTYRIAGRTFPFTDVSYFQSSYFTCLHLRVIFKFVASNTLLQPWKRIVTTTARCKKLQEFYATQNVFSGQTAIRRFGCLQVLTPPNFERI